MCHKSRSRVKENPHDDWEHGIGDDINIKEHVGYHDVGPYTIEHNQGEEQRQTAVSFVVILSKEVQIEHEANHQNTDKEHQSFLCDATLSFERLLLVAE